LEKLKKRRLRRTLLYVFVGLIVVAALVVGGSYAWLNCQVSERHVTTTGEFGTSLAAPIDPPESMDILVLGCDQRPDSAGEETRSDTVMLMHIDKEAEYLSILSLPRDLRVEVPGHGMHKLNWAYSKGGRDLTAATIENLTNLEIEHFVEVDFKAFSDMVDALGGVYLDIDRRYYNDSADSDYEHIKISPGYQLMHGADALDYVRFRHDRNSDFGRMNRQQRFLTALREQAMGWNLALDLPGVIKALFSNLETTLGTNDIVRLAYWGVGLDGNRIRQVSLIGNIQEVDGESVVIPEEGALEEAMAQLLTPSATGGGVATTTGSTEAEVETTTTLPLTSIDPSEFTTDPDAIENSTLWHEFAASVPFQVRAPGYLPDTYSWVDSNPSRNTYGAYDIQVGNDVEKAVKMVYKREGTDQYLGIMQTTWLDAPAASKGRQEVEHNGITYTIVGTSQSTDHVWWVQDDVLYWVSNTLSYSLSPRELLKVAWSMIAVPGGVSD